MRAYSARVTTSAVGNFGFGRLAAAARGGARAIAASTSRRIRRTERGAQSRPRSESSIAPWIAAAGKRVERHAERRLDSGRRLRSARSCRRSISSFDLDLRRHALREPRRPAPSPGRRASSTSWLRASRSGVPASVAMRIAASLRASATRARLGDGSSATRRRVQATRAPAAAVGRETRQPRRENAETAARRRLRQVIDDRALAEHRFAHRRDPATTKP